MRMKTVGNKRDDLCLVIRNADTVALLPGQAAILNFPFAGTQADGVDAVGANAAATAFAGFNMALLYGVVVSPATSGGIPPNGYGEVQAFGFCGNVQFTLATRASTNSIWPSYAAVSATAATIGLYPETLANGWTTNAIQSFTPVSTSASPSAFTQFIPPVVLGQSFASATTQASSLPGYVTATALTISVKAFVRLM